MAYKTAIFDLDGTILDTLEDLYRSVNHALEAFDMPRRTRDEVRLFTGNGIRRLIERSVPQDTSAETTAQVLEEFKRHYGEHSRDHTGPYAGIPEMLHALEQRGVERAVVSNKADFAVQELVATTFPGMFEAVVGEQAGITPKPNSDMVWAALTLMGKTSLDGVVYIGDSEVDIQTAEKAGCPCIAVTWGFRDVAWLRDHGATTIVSTPEELLAQIVGNSRANGGK